MAEGTSVIHPVQPARQIFEHNTAALGLISVQNRLDVRNQRGWESRIGSEDSYGMKRCTANNEAGIPHGIAGDVFASLLTQAQIEKQNGLPFAQLCVTTSDIVRYMASDTKDKKSEKASKPSKMKERHPAVIERALLSLSGSVYHIESGWYDTYNKRRRGAQFSLLDSVSWDVTDHPFNPQQSSRRYIIRMNQDILNSLHSDLVLALDPMIMNKLGSPTARGIFRMLEAQRRPSENINDIKPSLVLPIGKLAEDARLLTPRREAGYLLRLLTVGFDKLSNEGYLSKWSWSGKGDAMVVSFEFAADGQVLNTGAANRLAAYGVSRGRADSLALAYDSELVDCAIWHAETKSQADPTITNPPGLAISFLTDGTAAAMLPTYHNRHRVRAAPKIPKTPKTQARVLDMEVKQPESPRVSNRTFITLWHMNKILSAPDMAFLNLRNDRGDFDQEGLAAIAALGLMGSALKDRVRKLLEL